MPTNKPKIQVILEDDIYKVLKEIAEKDMRSISQMGGYIITKYIQEYIEQQEREEHKHDLEKSSISRTG